MANHVYFTIHIEGIDENDFNKHVKSENRVGKNYEGNEYKYEELLEIEEQPYMANVPKEFDKEGYLMGSYEWYCEKVGAKWCHIEEMQDGYISGHSAWSQPVRLVLNLMEFYANEYDTEVTASMTYEDEFRNFMGKQYFGTEVDEDFEDYDAEDKGLATGMKVALNYPTYKGWTAWEGDYTETDGTALCEQFDELYPSLNSSDDDFEWHDEYEVDGETIYPSEVLDELADEFWSRC